MNQLALAGVALLLAACGARAPAQPGGRVQDPAPAAADGVAADTALFAMGCFWCAEEAFEGRAGIVDVVSGFSGGTVPNPSYDQVVTGRTGHYEVVEVVYDAAGVSYGELLRLFWRNVDPVDNGGQFCDRGDQYRAAIFVRTPEQRRLASASLDSVRAAGRFPGPISVGILDAAPFYPAEDFHQDFAEQNPERYYSYLRGCRREERLDEVWEPEP